MMNTQPCSHALRPALSHARCHAHADSRPLTGIPPFSGRSAIGTAPAALTLVPAPFLRRSCAVPQPIMTVPSCWIFQPLLTRSCDVPRQITQLLGRSVPILCQRSVYRSVAVMPLHCPSAPLHRPRRHAPHCAAMLAGRSLAVQEPCRHAGASPAAALMLPARRVERIGRPARCCRSFSLPDTALIPWPF